MKLTKKILGFAALSCLPITMVTALTSCQNNGANKFNVSITSVDDPSISISETKAEKGKIYNALIHWVLIDKKISTIKVLVDDNILSEVTNFSINRDNGQLTIFPEYVTGEIKIEVNLVPPEFHVSVSSPDGIVWCSNQWAQKGQNFIAILSADSASSKEIIPEETVIVVGETEVTLTPEEDYSLIKRKEDRNYDLEIFHGKVCGPIKITLRLRVKHVQTEFTYTGDEGHTVTITEESGFAYGAPNWNIKIDWEYDAEEFPRKMDNVVLKADGNVISEEEYSLNVCIGLIYINNSDLLKMEKFELSFALVKSKVASINIDPTCATVVESAAITPNKLGEGQRYQGVISWADQTKRLDYDSLVVTLDGEPLVKGVKFLWEEATHTLIIQMSATKEITDASVFLVNFNIIE